MPSYFYPGYDEPTTDVHKHFVVQDGAPIPSITPQIHARLISLVQSLRSPASPTVLSYTYWEQASRFRTAMYMLFAYFGVENATVEVMHMNDTPKLLYRFEIDPEVVMERTGEKWPKWSDWVHEYEGGKQRLDDHCLEKGLDIPDWPYIIWRQGVAVRENHGYRLRPVQSHRGETHFDKCIQHLGQNPKWLALLNAWALNLSTSRYLSMIMSNGDVSSEGILLRREAVELNQEQIRSHFKIKKENEYVVFRRELWPIIMQPLLREAFRLHRAHAENGDNPRFWQTPFVATMPVAMPPEMGSDALTVALTTREIRETIGSTLELVSKLGRSASYSSNSEVRAGLETLVSSEEARLARLRSISTRAMEQFHRYFEIYTAEITAPTFLAIDGLAMLDYGAHSLGVESASSIDPDPETDVPSKPEYAFESDEESFAIREVDVTFPSDDIDSIRQRINEAEETQASPIPSGEYDGCMLRHESDIQTDVSQLGGQTTRHRWARLTQAIELLITSAPQDETRQWGKEKLWYRAALGVKAKAEMRKQGGVELREVKRFSRASAGDNAFAIGVLLHSFAEDMGQEEKSLLIREIAMILAWVYISDRPFLYVTHIDHVIDMTTFRYCSATRSASKTETIAALSAIGNFSNGFLISASIGSRTLQGGRHWMLCIRTWIRGLLFPIATVQGLPFGSGPRLGCQDCGGEVQLQLPDEAEPGGLTGVFRPIRLVDRLSVSTFAVRRGVNAMFTQAAGRTAFYDCLVQLFVFWFHPTFIITFLYFSYVVHFTDKARRGKTVISLTEEGFRSVATL